MLRRVVTLLTLLSLSACTAPAPADPTARPTQPPSPKPTSAPSPISTDLPAGTPPPTSSPARALLEGIDRTAATDADRANAAAVAAADLPVSDNLELAIRLKGLPADTPRVTCTAPQAYAVGDQESFKVFNSDTLEQFPVTATLVASEPNVHMWVDDQWLSQVDRGAVAAAGRIFSEQIVPRDRQVFGMEWSPGIDCDPRLHVLHTSNTGAAGYFWSADEFPAAARPDSNEKELFTMDLLGIGGPQVVGSSYYLGVLAHEFQHMIHERTDPNEDGWANEGLSDLAMYLNGYSTGGHEFFFADEPDTQLNFWPEGGGQGANYGAAFLFWLYFYDRFGEPGIVELVANPLNGLPGVADTLAELGYTGTVDDFFADWVVAKVLDSPSLADGRYGFARTDPPTARVAEVLNRFPYRFDQPQPIHQYAAQYYQLQSPRDVRIDFAGSTRAQLVDADPHSGRFFWWSNRGDTANMRLTREFDLSGVDSAQLSYWTWYDLEEDWDYAYVTVSTDGGRTFETLATPSGTDTNPVSNNLGWGYTGNSGGGASPVWIQETVDLTPYAGQHIVLRFETVSDGVVNLPGFAIDDIEIPEIGFEDDAETDAGWTSEGWVRTSNYVPQNWIVQAVGYGQDGQTHVMRLPLNEDNTGSWHLPLSQWNSAILIVSPTATKTSERAWFDWEIVQQ